jgi:purine-binding chemotaxis protein CheW
MKAVGFRINTSHYGLDIMKIAEVINYIPAQRLPGTPSFLEGIITIRERTVIPAIDFRKRLEEPCSEITPDTRIIIIKQESQFIGLIVDEASEVFTYSVDDVVEKSDYVVNLKTQYIGGFLYRNNRTIILLNIDLILSTEESLLLDEFCETLEQG